MNKRAGGMNRRQFARVAAGAAVFTAVGSSSGSPAGGSGRIRMGGPVFGKPEEPETWARAHRQAGYRAAWCPVESGAGDQEVHAYETAAKQAGIVIAEVGAWSNSIGPDVETGRKSVETCISQLDLADRIGALCCVNISGSRGPVWDGPHPDNLTDETFEMIVEVTRRIIDQVKPKRTYFTLETMPWAYPDSADSYLRLLKAIDRERFAVHLDPVNLICSPQRYFRSGELIRECFAKLGPWIKSCHAKDIRLQDKLTTHLDEVRPGTGGLDYTAYLTELAKLDDVPLMLEHMKEEEEYRLAGEYIRSVAGKVGVSFD